MKKIILCGHTGSDNRGSEAIMRSTSQIIKKDTGASIYYTTYYPQQDEKLGSDPNFAGQVRYNLISGFTFDRIYNSIVLRISKDYYHVESIFQKHVWKALSSDSIALNVGGDTYCYNRNARLVSYALNRFCSKRNIPNIFWGCSIEKNLIDEEMVEDLKRYSLIVTRESLSYNTLVTAGIPEEKIRLFPDSAFTLPIEEIELPPIFNTDVIGINLSPLVVNPTQNGLIVKQNFEKLIDYILENTGCSIALIPHVYYDYSEGRQDVETMQYFKDKYSTSERVYLFRQDMNCKQLKFIISNCRFFIGARTHATIAAYSSGIPTLVIGYSVKSKGIATDIFGFYENYVIPVEEILSELDVLNKFKFIESNEENITTHLRAFMPAYIESAWNSGYELLPFLNS